jgi:hypothetical protein
MPCARCGTFVDKVGAAVPGLDLCRECVGVEVALSAVGSLEDPPGVRALQRRNALIALVPAALVALLPDDVLLRALGFVLAYAVIFFGLELVSRPERRRRYVAGLLAQHRVVDATGGEVVAPVLFLWHPGRGFFANRADQGVLLLGQGGVIFLGVRGTRLAVPRAGTRVSFGRGLGVLGIALPFTHGLKLELPSGARIGLLPVHGARPAPLESWARG